MIKFILLLVCVLLGACAGTDHRRIITQHVYVFDQAYVEISPEVLLEKIGQETSSADNTTDLKATVPLVP